MQIAPTSKKSNKPDCGYFWGASRSVPFRSCLTGGLHDSSTIPKATDLSRREPMLLRSKAMFVQANPESARVRQRWLMSRDKVSNTYINHDPGV
jgi:hypothetical protein